MGKWENGIRVGLSEKMKVGANDSNEMLINLTSILLLEFNIHFNCNTTAKIRKILQISHSKSKKFQKKLQVSKKVLIFAARKERISSR